MTTWFKLFEKEAIFSAQPVNKGSMARTLKKNFDRCFIIFCAGSGGSREKQLTMQIEQILVNKSRTRVSK